MSPIRWSVILSTTCWMLVACGARKPLDATSGGFGGGGGGGAIGIGGRGGTYDGLGGTAGSAGGTAGAGGEGGSNSCAAPTHGRSAPFATQIRFRNDGNIPLFVHTGCVGVDFGISSCASGFRDQLGPTYHCACPCGSSSCAGPLACGACPRPDAAMVPPGGAVSVTWMGVEVSDSMRTRQGGGTFACVNERVLPAGRYRVAIRVYTEQARAADDVGGMVVTRDFELPNAGDIVEVPLTATTDCAGTGNSVPACIGTEARQVKCALADGLTYAWEGGLSIYTDSAAITPPDDHLLRRVFLDTTKPEVTCRSTIPQCSFDSRVVTAADIVRVTRDPSVAAAFASGPTPVYGYDDRANDGAILILRRPGGTSLGIGRECADCSNAAVARPLTPALREVARVFTALRRQQASTVGCAAAFVSP